MKTVLITGTSQGLGLSLTNTFLNSGYNVIGLSRKPQTVSHKNYVHYCADITDVSTLKEVFENISQVDVLINNAAVFKMENFKDMDLETLDSIIDINLKGSMYVTKLCLPKMSVHSKIIFINSVAGLRELEKQSVYCASKHGLKAFAGVLGEEMRGLLNVSSIHPGGINTPLWNEGNPYPCGEQADALDPSEIAQMALLIAQSSPKTNYKTVTMFPYVEWH